MQIMEFDQLLNGLNEDRKANLYIYGVGRRGKTIISILQKMNFVISGVIDRRFEKIIGTYMNIPIVSVDCLSENDYVLVTPSEKDEILAYLSSKRILGVAYTDESVFLMDVLYRLGEYVNEPLNINNPDILNRKYEEMRNKKIKVYYMWCSRVGELIYRFMIMSRELADKKDYIVIPLLQENESICNKELLNIMGRYINIIKKSDIAFYIFLSLYHPEVFSLENANYFDSYSSDIRLSDTSINFKKPFIQLNDDELRLSEDLFTKLGIKRDYVCVFSRDRKYQENLGTLSEDDINSTDFRNSSIRLYDLLVEYLHHNGIDVVRVGSDVDHEYVNPYVIDFAYRHYNQLLDLYVQRNCRYWIGNGSGANLIPMLFGKSVIRVNIAYLVDMAFATVYKKDEIYSCKLYYLESQKRYLNLCEILSLNLKDKDVSRYKYKYGISIIDNSPEDILELYKEAVERFEGRWKPSLLELRLEEKYWKILNSFLEKYRFVRPFAKLETDKTLEYCIPTIPIGMSFLKRYSFLLEVSENDSIAL